MKKYFITLLLSILLVALCAVNSSAANFQDVPTDAWYAESVRFVSEKGIMDGTGGGTFAPDRNVTRGMIVTILYRMEGIPAVSGSSSFQDVSKGTYYEKAVIWAEKNSIVNGYSTTQFGPNDSITREQFATILYRYCSYQHGNVSTNGNMSQYTDADEISSYAKTAMLWANANGLITGTSAATLLPKGNATRAQAAAIIMRYVEKISANQLSEDNHGTSVVPGDEKPNPDNPGQKETEDDNPIQNTTQPTLTVQTVSAQAGERISVDVDIANNPGILGMTLTVSYDEQSLTLLKAESGSAVNDVLTFVSAKSLKSGSSFVWYGTYLNNEQVKDGTVLTLSFEVSGSAKGSLPIVLTVANGDIVDNNLQTVNILLKSGSVQIK